jgi:hypothetical protein
MSAQEERPLLGAIDLCQEDERICSSNGLAQRVDEMEERPAPTPLPMKQISILLLITLAEPIAYTVIL